MGDGGRINLPRYLPGFPLPVAALQPLARVLRPTRPRAPEARAWHSISSSKQRNPPPSPGRLTPCHVRDKEGGEGKGAEPAEGGAGRRGG